MRHSNFRRRLIAISVPRPPGRDGGSLWCKHVAERCSGQCKACRRAPILIWLGMAYWGYQDDCAVLQVNAQEAFTEASLSKAFRRLAKEVHPDKNQDGAEAFKRLSAARDRLVGSIQPSPPPPLAPPAPPPAVTSSGRGGSIGTQGGTVHNQGFARNQGGITGNQGGIAGTAGVSSAFCPLRCISQVGQKGHRREPDLHVLFSGNGGLFPLRAILAGDHEDASRRTVGQPWKHCHRLHRLVAARDSKVGGAKTRYHRSGGIPARACGGGLTSIRGSDWNFHDGRVHDTWNRPCLQYCYY